MKETRIMFRQPGSRISIRKAPDLALGMWVLAAVLFICATANRAHTWEQRPEAPPVAQKQPAQIGEDEKNSYLAAKQEADVNKRAFMLVEFLQKYPKSALMQQSDFEIVRKYMEEFDAYYPITRETDFDNRALMLIDFLQKYPKSAFFGEIKPEYVKMLEESAKGKKYHLLESLGEQWLKIHPNDKDAYGYLVEATCGLGKYERCGQWLEEIYRLQPLPSRAREIYECYQKTENLAKQIEWAENLFKIQPQPALAREIFISYQKTGDLAKQDEWAGNLMRMPEFEDDYALRYGFVTRYYKDNNLPKAAEYAKLTLRSLDLAKQPDAKTREQQRQVRRACHHVIASDLLEKGDCAGAIAAFKTASQIEKYDQGYYEIGLCMDKQKQIDEASLYYAMAELTGGDNAPKAKSRLETLYKALHNNTLIGIHKVYTKAKELLEEQ